MSSQWKRRAKTKKNKSKREEVRTKNFCLLAVASYWVSYSCQPCGVIFTLSVVPHLAKASPKPTTTKREVSVFPSTSATKSSLIFCWISKSLCDYSRASLYKRRMGTYSRQKLGRGRKQLLWLQSNVRSAAADYICTLIAINDQCCSFSATVWCRANKPNIWASPLGHPLGRNWLYRGRNVDLCCTTGMYLIQAAKPVFLKQAQARTELQQSPGQ